MLMGETLGLAPAMARANYLHQLPGFQDGRGRLERLPISGLRVAPLGAAVEFLPF